MTAHADRVMTLPYRVLAWVAEWEADSRSARASITARSYRLLIWRLGVSAVLLLILTGAITSWHEGSGQNSVLAAVLAQVTWTSYAIVQLILVAPPSCSNPSRQCQSSRLVLKVQI